MLLARTSTDADASKMAMQRVEPKANDARMLQKIDGWNFGNQILHGSLLRFAVDAVVVGDGVGVLQRRLANGG